MHVFWLSLYLIQSTLKVPQAHKMTSHMEDKGLILQPLSRETFGSKPLWLLATCLFQATDEQSVLVSLEHIIGPLWATVTPEVTFCERERVCNIGKPQKFPQASLLMLRNSSFA